MSIDEAEASNLRELADEVMGPDNFIAQIVWSGGRKNDSKYISVSHEYVLCYAKSVDYLVEHGIKWRKRKQGLNEIYDKYEQLRSEFGSDDSAVQRALKEWYKGLPEGSPSKAHKHYSAVDSRGIYFPDNISWPGGGGPRYEVLHPTTGKPVAIPSRGWLFGTPERMKEIIDMDLVEFGEDETKVPCYKRYLKDTEYEVPYSVLYKDGRAASKRLARLMGGKVFDNPKDEEIIAELISYVDKPDSIVMDFFSGSATTAQAVMMRNVGDNGSRRYILVQLPENLDSNLSKATKQSTKKVIQGAIDLCDELDEPHTICSIAEERICRAGDQLKAEVEQENGQMKLDEQPKQLPDIGFRVFELDTSGIDRPKPGELRLDVVNPDRSDLDIVFEMMLKWGLDLSLPVEQSEAAGYPIWSVACDELICCLAPGLTQEALEAIAALEPRRVFILDRVLNDALKLNAIQIFKHALEPKGLTGDGEGSAVEIELRTV